MDDTFLGLMIFAVALVILFAVVHWMETRERKYKIDMANLKIKMKERDIIHDNVRQGAYLPKKESKIRYLNNIEDDEEDDDLDEIEDLRYR